MTQGQVSLVLEAYASLAVEEVLASGRMNLPGIGRIKTMVRKPIAERKTVNPRTGEPMTIPEAPSKRHYKVKLSKEFLDRVEARNTTK